MFISHREKALHPFLKEVRNNHIWIITSFSLIHKYVKFLFSLCRLYIDWTIYSLVKFSSENFEIFSLLCQGNDLHSCTCGCLLALSLLTNLDTFWLIHQSGRGHSHHYFDSLNCQNCDSGKGTQILCGRDYHPLWQAHFPMKCDGPMALLPNLVSSYSLKHLLLLQFWEMNGDFC